MRWLSDVRSLGLCLQKVSICEQTKPNWKRAVDIAPGHKPSHLTTLYNVCSVHRGIPLVHRRDTISTSEGYHDARGRYHEYIGGCSVHQGFQYILKGFCHLAPPHAS